MRKRLATADYCRWRVFLLLSFFSLSRPIFHFVFLPFFWQMYLFFLLFSFFKLISIYSRLSFAGRLGIVDLAVSLKKFSFFFSFLIIGMILDV